MACGEPPEKTDGDTRAHGAWAQVAPAPGMKKAPPGRKAGAPREAWDSNEKIIEFKT
jgi:hypothetical protein